MVQLLKLFQAAQQWMGWYHWSTKHQQDDDERLRHFPALDRENVSEIADNEPGPLNSISNSPLIEPQSKCGFQMHPSKPLETTQYLKKQLRIPFRCPFQSCAQSKEIATGWLSAAQLFAHINNVHLVSGKLPPQSFLEHHKKQVCSQFKVLFPISNPCSSCMNRERKTHYRRKYDMNKMPRSK